MNFQVNLYENFLGIFYEFFSGRGEFPVNFFHVEFLHFPSLFFRKKSTAFFGKKFTDPFPDPKINPERNLQRGEKISVGSRLQAPPRLDPKLLAFPDLDSGVLAHPWQDYGILALPGLDSELVVPPGLDPGLLAFVGLD